MRFAARGQWFGRTLGLLLASTAGSAWAAAPSAADALKLAPVQHDVEYDVPRPAEVASASIKAEQFAGHTGWVVRGSSGQILRRFVDTNGDNVVDQWSYFAGGLEVYRDIDHNFNGKADEYRWLNTAGIRWGLDANEDGRIDTWKTISAEEVSAEVVRAVAERDSNRFARLLISRDEMQSLGLSSAQAEKLAAKVKEAPQKFQSFLASVRGGSSSLQSVSDSKPKWVHFGGSLPGLVPAGTSGSTKDVVVYENVMAMVEQSGKHDQIPIGTMVEVGKTWRLIDAPRKLADGQELAATDGFFFPSQASKGTDANPGSDASADNKLQGLMADLEKLDEELRRADRSELPRLQAKRADLVEQVAEASPGENREMWLRQMADTVMAAVQSGEYPEGVVRLSALKEKLAKSGASDDLLAYIAFRSLQADYGQKLNAPKPNFEDIQKWWLENLEKYASAHPRGDDTAEALMQLGIAQEFAGDETAAKKWYGRIVSDFPKASTALKAAGAVARLNSVGKSIALAGTTAEGKAVNLSQFRGKVVVVQYWATTSGPCTADMAQLKELLAKYKKDGLEIIGVSLDSQKAELVAFLQSHRVPWSNLYEPGGLDSRLATSMGILTLPTMLLIDKQGQVVNRNVNAVELDREIGALLR